MGAAATGILAQRTPGFGQPCDPLDRGVDLVAKLSAQTWALLIVEEDRVAEVAPGSLEEPHSHRSLNSSNTSSAGYASMRPAS
jgi:hypothetical protein